MKKMKYITHKDFKKESFKRVGVVDAHKKLELEFKILDMLIEARVKNKLTQKSLAEKIGIAQSALARFESGRGNPTLSFIQKVTAGLGLRLVVK